MYQPNEIVALALLSPLLWFLNMALLVYLIEKKPRGDMSDKDKSGENNAIAFIAMIIVMAIWGVYFLIR